MRSLPIILLLLFTTNLFAQDNRLIGAKLSEADSVILVSYEIYADRENEPEVISQQLAIDGKLNERIFIEKLVLTRSSIDTLSCILVRPFEDERISITRCFNPHQAIFVFRNGNISYLDLCFDCRNFDVTPDLNSLEPFDTLKWIQLEQFFLGLGFRYGFEELMD